MNKEPKYSIKAVSRLTGLSTHLIRAWERRYKLINPERTETNRRLYSDEDIARLKLLNKAIAIGFNIGSISTLSDEKLKSIIKSPPGTPTSRNLPIEDNQKDQANLSNVFIKDSIEAIKGYHPEILKDTLLKASIDLSQKELLNLMLIPIINYIGDSWQYGSLSIAQEHMASAVIVNFLQYLKGMYKNADNAPVLLSATPQGEFHELGALIISSVAASEGWNVIHLGTNLPLDELLRASEEISAKVICLSLVFLSHDMQAGHYLKKLNELTANKRKIIIGGRAARTYINVIEGTEILLIEDINDFRIKLGELH